MVRRRFLPLVHSAFSSILLETPYRGKEPEDLEAFTWVCHQQGVLGGLALRIREFGHSNRRFREWAERKHRDEVVQGSRYLALLTKLHRRLEAASLPVLLLKGAALNLTLYADLPGVRHLSDVDLYVDGSRQGDLRVMFAEMGFYARSGKTFSHESGLNIDLHGPGLGRLEDACGLEAMDLLRRSTAAPGFPFFSVLSPWDQLSYLSVHAVKHSFERLVWLLDVGLLTKSLVGVAPNILPCAERPWQVCRTLIDALTGVLPAGGSLEQRLLFSMLTHYQHPLGAFLLSCYQPGWKRKVRVLRQAFFEEDRQGLKQYARRAWMQGWSLMRSIFRGASSKKDLP